MLLGLLAVKLLVLVQAAPPSLSGVVRDGEGGRPLADAVVSLPDLDRLAVTDSLGRYLFADVLPGPQHLTVRRIGYGPRTLHAFVPETGRLEIDVTLHAVAVQLEPLVVRRLTAMRGLEAQDSSPYAGRSVSAEAIHNDPFLSEPDDFLALSGAEVSAAPESPSGMHVRGAASDQTGYVLDGFPVFSPYHAAGVFSAWNPDAVERVQLSSASLSPAFPAALSGTVSGATRSPGPILGSQGSMSTSQARISLDGPLGSSGAGFLASVRKSYPSWYAPHDATYLSGQTEDALMKLEAPLLSGSLRVLYYEMGNSIGTATRTVASGPVRDGFDWGSRSMGMRWSRRTGVGTIQLQGWSAGLETEATWLGSAAVGLSSRRDDFGLQALVERSGSASSTLAGVRYEWSRTGYRAESLDGGGGGPRLQLGARTPAATGFLQHQRGLGRGITADAALSTTAAAAGVFLDLQGGIHYRLSRALTLSAGYVRAHQFAQSLRNSESVVGNIFPAELYLGAGNREVPVARNDRGILALDYRPSAGFRIGAQGYLSRSTGLLLVAPTTGEPFATTGFSTGSGTAPGVSLDATLRGSRFGLLANVSWQRVRLWYGDSSYQPAYADGRSFQLGGTMFPTATSSIKLALTGADGRRATGVAGAFEWEACNLVDQGCEFSGMPESNGALGGTRLPGYLRLDLGVRQHWHLHLRQRDMMVAVYGTFSNLLGRGNILNIITDPATGGRSAIQMRPRAPLVVGTDWHF